MKKIAIIGAGISGLFFANLIEKNKYYSYKIFERKVQTRHGQGRRKPSVGRQLHVGHAADSAVDPSLLDAVLAHDGGSEGNDDDENDDFTKEDIDLLASVINTRIDNQLQQRDSQLLEMKRSMTKFMKTVSMLSKATEVAVGLITLRIPPDNCSG